MNARLLLRSFGTTKRRRRFVDHFRLQLHGGRGGNGCLSQRRLGPVKSILDGGNGGMGGSVVIRACKDTQSLSFPATVYKAPPGANGSSNNKHGKQGKDVVLRVPVGTVVRVRGYHGRDDIQGEEEEDGLGFEDEDDSQGLSTLDPGLDDHSSTFQEVADLITDGQEYLAAAGGLGGRGNADVSSPLAFKRGRPRFAARAEGSDGDFCEAELSLKTIADVGLVGFPNAGKSSLLGAVSSSTPEVAEYPFTTLHPYVGVVRFTDADRFTIADIPGLVEGASENKGLGHRFLRHVERTSALVFVLDASHVQTKSLVHDFLALVEELERYQPGLSTKPCLLLLNKVDVAEKEVESSRKEEVLLERWCAEVQALERDEPEAALKFPQIDMVLPVSAMQGYGIRDAVHGIRRLLEKTGMTMGEGLSR